MTISPKKELSVFDSTCIIVGIIIGAGIYETAPTIASCMASSSATLWIWLIGGLLALAGSLCYAELATAYPHEGGDYVYLTRAYGRGMGFLFGWSQMVIIRPGDIALMAFIFARYADQLFPLKHYSIYAVAAIAVLTVINIIGVKGGKWTQNILTVIKIAGLFGIFIAGLFASPIEPQATAAGEFSAQGLKLALILVLFTYGGWHEMAYVAAEVKNPHKNIVRAILTGTIAVTVLYLLVNYSFIRALGYEAFKNSSAVAVDTIAAIFPDTAGKIISILICISALGAVNGLVFTGARITYALGTGHRIFNSLGKWNTRSGTPIRALVIQGLISIAIVLIAGSFIDTIIYTAPVFWLFFLSTAVSVIVLRFKEPNTPRPFKVIAYPLTSLIFCACCAFMLYSCITYAWEHRTKYLIFSIATITAGIIFYSLTKNSKTD